MKIKNPLNFFIAVSLIVFLNFTVFSLDLSNISLDTVVERLKNDQPVNNQVNYIWSGSIIGITEKNSGMEVRVVKGKWINKDKLLSYEFILVIKDKSLIKKVKSIGLHKKAIFIVRIISIKDKIIPVCTPLIIKEA